MPVKVLHVVNSLSPSGGAEHGLVREAVALAGRLDQQVVRLYQQDSLEEDLNESGIPTHSLGLSSTQSGWNWIVGARRLKSLIRDIEPDVLNTTLASGNLVGQLAGGATDTPVLSTFTLSGDPALMRAYQPGAALPHARVLRKIEAMSARRPHVWFRALTSDAADSNTKALGIDRSRLTVIPRGVPFSVGVGVDREQLGLPDDVPLLLNVGRQTAQKGHVDLIEVFAQIADDRPAHLVILGREGDGTEPLQGAIDRFGVRESVTVIDHVRDPFPYYTAADVMVFPSFMEGLGTAVLESMASRLPVVAYDIPPVREIAGDSQWARLVTVGDKSAMVEQVNHLLDTPGEAAQLGQSAYQMVQGKYTVDRVADQLETLLTDVAGRSLQGEKN